MPLIEWSDKLSVNIKELDEQHKRLVSLINYLHEAMSAGKGRSELGSILDELVDYTKIHFANEEKLMLKYTYPGYINHQKLHADLTKKVMEYKKQFSTTNYSLGIQVSSFLQEWLTQHILIEDKQYSTFFNNKGIV